MRKNGCVVGMTIAHGHACENKEKWYQKRYFGLWSMGDGRRLRWRSLATTMLTECERQKWKQKPKQMAKLLFNAAILGKLSHSLGDWMCARLSEAVSHHSCNITSTQQHTYVRLTHIGDVPSEMIRSFSHTSMYHMVDGARDRHVAAEQLPGYLYDPNIYAKACLFSIQFWLTVDLCALILFVIRWQVPRISYWRCRRRRRKRIDIHTLHRFSRTPPRTHCDKFIWLSRMR